MRGRRLRDGRGAAPDTDTDASDTDGDTDTDADADTDTDTDTGEPYVVTCDTGVVEDAPCTVDADGDGDWLTIQEAVDAASEGDVITVCPGVYDGVRIERVGVTLAGYGASSTCIIGTTGPGILIRSGLDVDIGGFTVSGQGDDETAGAIDAYATGTFHDLRITGVQPNALGAKWAILLLSGDTTWERVTLEENEVEDTLYIVHANVTIRHSVFARNVTAVLVNNTLAVEDTLVLTNNIFMGNERGLYAGVRGSATIANNVFYDNWVGLEVEHGEDIAVRNNVALANGFGYGGGSPDHDYNLAWANGTDWGPSTHGTNDLSVDPQFENPAAGDFRPKAASPLIDAGDPTPAYNDPDGTRNDIGVFGGPHGMRSPP